MAAVAKKKRGKVGNRKGGGKGPNKIKQRNKEQNTTAKAPPQRKTSQSSSMSDR